MIYVVNHGNVGIIFVAISYKFQVYGCHKHINLGVNMKYSPISALDFENICCLKAKIKERCQVSR